MAEPFNIEQFRQQMAGQVPPVEQPAPMQPQPQPPVMHNPAAPQPYQPQSMPQQATQSMPQPQPYQAPSQQMAPPMVQQMVQPMPQPMAQPQHYAPQLHPQGQAVPPQPAQTQPLQGQPQVWAPQGQPQQMQQPMSAQHMPPPPAFAPPPSAVPAEQGEQTVKKSKFKLKLPSKGKAPKIKKVKSEQAVETSEGSHKGKTSPAMIFMFGMATGIACFFLGNMVISALFGDSSPKNFAEIERLNTNAQETVVATTTPETMAETKAIVEENAP